MAALLLLLAAAAPAVLLQPLRRFATSQGLEAGAAIVETNQLIAALEDPEAAACDGAACTPLREALERQRSQLLPPRARSAVAHTRLWGAQALVALADAGESLLLSEGATRLASVTEELLDARELLGRSQRDGRPAAAPPTDEPAGEAAAVPLPPDERLMELEAKVAAAEAALEAERAEFAATVAAL